METWMETVPYQPHIHSLLLFSSPIRSIHRNRIISFEYNFLCLSSFPFPTHGKSRGTQKEHKGQRKARGPGKLIKVTCGSKILDNVRPHHHLTRGWWENGIMACLEESQPLEMGDPFLHLEGWSQMTHFLNPWRLFEYWKILWPPPGYYIT